MMNNEMKPKRKWTAEESSIAQDFYCDSHDCPRFAPRDGFCYRCGKNVFDYYSPEKASKKLITSCPYCNVSFCD